MPKNISQKQNVKQSVIINVAPLKRRKRRRKRKQIKNTHIGDFRTALAKSAFIQRSLGGMGFNPAPQFRRDIEQNAVRLNARSQFEGIRRQRPTLKSVGQQTDSNTPIRTATGNIRGDEYTPRLLASTLSPFPSVQSEIQAVLDYSAVIEEEKQQEQHSSPIATRLRQNRKESPYDFG